MSLGGRPCALQGGKPLTQAVPMTLAARTDGYRAASGRPAGPDLLAGLTSAQRRRASKKMNHHEATARRPARKPRQAAGHVAVPAAQGPRATSILLAPERPRSITWAASVSNSIRSKLGVGASYQRRGQR